MEGDETNTKNSVIKNCIGRKNWPIILISFGVPPVVKVRGQGAHPPVPIWAPCNSMSPPDWIYKVLFYAQITPN